MKRIKPKEPPRLTDDEKAHCKKLWKRWLGNVISVPLRLKNGKLQRKYFVIDERSAKRIAAGIQGIQLYLQKN